MVLLFRKTVFIGKQFVLLQPLIHFEYYSCINGLSSPEVFEKFYLTSNRYSVELSRLVEVRKQFLNEVVHSLL